MEYFEELKARVKDCKNKVLVNFFTAEGLGFFIAKNNPELKPARIRKMISMSFEQLMDRKMNKEDIRKIKKVYVSIQPFFFDIPGESPDFHDQMTVLVDNYHRIAMFGTKLSEDRLFRTAPSHVSHEYVRRSNRRFRRITLDRMK